LAHNPSDLLVTLIGGSGFIGRHMVRALAKRGYRIRVACRRPDLAGHLQPLGVPGQVVAVQANVRYPASLAAACNGAYAVVYLPSTFNEKLYEATNVFGAQAAAVQRPVGMPVGAIQPIFQDNRMNRNSAIDKPTRTASARAMRASRRSPLWLSSDLRSMKKPALAKAPSTPTSAMTMTNFMLHCPTARPPC